QAGQNSNPFACVLVDGDGAVFNEQFIARGEEGGKEAGDMLYHGLKKRLQADQELCDLGITNIMVQVYLNVEGMGRALHNAGLLGTGLPADAVRQLTQFGRGFNRAQMLFSFIDVGREKEAADHKIRSLFELMEKILNCKCLILAGCHDNGYGRLLDTYEYKYRSEAPWHKIRLLVTTPTPEKSAYRTSQYRDAFPTMTLPEVFRSDPVVALGQAGYNNGSLSAPRTALNQPFHPTPCSSSPSSLALVPTPSPLPSTSKSAFYSKPNAIIPSRSLLPPSAPTHDKAPLRTGTQHQAPLTFKQVAFSQGAYYLNAMKQRIDPPLSCPTELSNRLKALGEILRPGGSPKEQRFCNKWHISGFCHAARHGCPYIHGERLTGDLLTAVRYNARNLKCKDSMKCRDVDCHMGHHCFKPWECSYSGCKFGDCHGVVFSLVSLQPRFLLLHARLTCGVVICR
ncbi:hypothetical protein V8F20_012701, partial [Naviculisporaceae sp. PSN 640]